MLFNQFLAALLGCALGVTSWLVSAAALNGGSVTIATTQQDYPMLIGNVTSLGLSMIISISGSLIWPENYSFDDTRALHAHSEASEEIEPTTPTEEKKGKGEVVPKVNSEASSLAEGPEACPSYRRTFNLARNISVPMFVILLVRYDNLAPRSPRFRC